jgi:TolA-binding protein
MTKKEKLVLLSAVLVVLLLGRMGPECLADVADELAQARQCEKDGDYAQAEAIYKQVVADYPDSSDAMPAQERLTVLYIAWDKQSQAEASYQQLLAQFSSCAGIAKAVDHVADQYREAGNYQKARTCYQHIVDSWPEAERAAEAQGGVARSSILSGDVAAAQEAIDKLLTAFSGNTYLAKAVDHVADEYRKRGSYHKARDLYKYAVQNHAGSEHAMESQKGLVLCDIALGDDPNAESAMNKLTSDYPANPGLPAVLCDVAGAYEKARRFDKAKNVYQQVMQQYPDSRHAEKGPLNIRRADILSLERGPDSD